MNFTYQDIRIMPVRYRHWYLNRLVAYFEKRNDMYDRVTNPSQTKDSDFNNFNKFNDMLNKKFSP